MRMNRYLRSYVDPRQVTEKQRIVQTDAGCLQWWEKVVDGKLVRVHPKIDGRPLGPSEFRALLLEHALVGRRS